MTELLQPAAWPWLALFPAMLLVWSIRTRRVAWALFALGFALAFAVGQATTPAFGAFAIAGAAAWLVFQRALWLRVLGHVIFLALAVVLRFHAFPGFHNPLVLDSAGLSPGAPSYRMYLNLDRVLVMVWIFATAIALRIDAPARRWLAVGAGVGAATATLCIGIAVAVGLIAFDPKSPFAVPIWLINNLILVTMTEEAFFRGYIQAGLARLFDHKAWGSVLAIAIAATLFGLSHLGSGIVYTALSVLAGIGYGVAYRLGGLQASVIAHAILNLAHFTLWSYPMLLAAAPAAPHP